MSLFKTDILMICPDSNLLAMQLTLIEIVNNNSFFLNYKLHFLHKNGDYFSVETMLNYRNIPSWG